MDAATRRFVRERAGNRCEYRCFVQASGELLHHIEHVIARQHGGSDDSDNLALAGHRCNLHKGPNLSGIDPLTVKLLFHPRRGQWASHFVFRGVYIDGLTPSGRATVEVLALNDLWRIEARQELPDLGE